MSIDDHPFDALEARFETEKVFTSPITTALIKVASPFSLPWPLDKILEGLKDRIAEDSHEKLRLMLATCIDEVRRHEESIKQLREQQTEYQSRQKVIEDLMQDAARKAENTRAEERIVRIGLILARVIVAPDQPNADEAEEMMRIAMNLSDYEIGFLSELIKVEAGLLQSRDFIPRYDAYTMWERCNWGTKIDPELDSAFSKLASYGLVAPIAPPNNLNISANIQNRYVLLRKGLRFASLTGKTSSGGL
jgi:hypothetical protein